MNKAITQGLVFMPPPFSAGLSLWSRQDGLTGQGSYDGQANAAYVPSDADFGGCLELQKNTTTQKLRCFQNIPFQPGLYLRVSLRIKAVSGPMPAVRIAGYAEDSSGANVTSAVQIGPSTQLTAYGQVVTIRAIIGPSNRQGVNMNWGTAPVLGHFGLDLTGPNGGVVRIDDIEIEDITSVFHAEMFDWVDVKDYGAKGDGITDDRAAFEAADTAANGRTVVVSPGSYFIATHMTFDNPVSFQGTITMPAGQRLICTRNFDLETYTAAFGSELEGFKRGLAALFFFSDHVAFDLRGRKVELNAPIDVASTVGLTTFTQRRVLSNGQLTTAAATAWNEEVVTATGSYNPLNPYVLSSVTNIGTIPVGARITGIGVGREVYVRSKNVGAGTLTLSLPLFGGSGTRSYTFTRHKYMLDFSGFTDLDRFELVGMEFLCEQRASAVMLPTDGSIFRMADCAISRPKDRGVSSIGSGCQGMIIENCQFLSWEFAVPAQDRTTIGFNVNANDVKIRNNRGTYFAHFGVMFGGSHLISGNHFWSVDSEVLGLRKAGLVLTQRNSRCFIVGNYIDNNNIELTNEHDADPNFTTGFSFGGITITGNLFLASGTSPAYRFIVISPRGTGHTLNGMVVSNNVFRATDGNIDRIESVDSSYASLNYGSFRNVVFQNNSMHGINQATESPLLIEHTQNTASDTWVVAPAGYLPFGGRARNAVSVTPKGALTNASNAVQFPAFYTLTEQGASANEVHVKWPSAVKGKVLAMVRVDNPL